MTLDALPVELLYEIQSFAVSPAFPLTSKHLYTVFKTAPLSIHVQYLIGSYYDRKHWQRMQIVSAALRYPLCTQPVLDALLCSPACPEVQPRGSTTLPRRLFRDLAPRSPIIVGSRKRKHDPHEWSEDDTPLPFLQWLADHPRIPTPDVNSFEGYALTHAVHVGFVPLMRFLLEQGADPGCKEGLAVKVAIRQKDLALVRMLIEPDGRARPEKMEKKRKTEAGAVDASGSTGADQDVEGGGREGQSEHKSVKRRKMEDRLKVTQAMLKLAVQCDARNIVQYFMKEKGCVPDMQTIMLMGVQD